MTSRIFKSSFGMLTDAIYFHVNFLEMVTTPYGFFYTLGHVIYVIEWHSGAAAD